MSGIRFANTDSSNILIVVFDRTHATPDRDHDTCCQATDVLTWCYIRKGTRYTDGLLFGSVSRRQGSETEDEHERRATTHGEAGELLVHISSLLQRKHLSLLYHRRLPRSSVRGFH